MVDALATPQTRMATEISGVLKVPVGDCCSKPAQRPRHLPAGGRPNRRPNVPT